MTRAAKGRRAWAVVLGLAAVLLAAALPAPESASAPSPTYAETRVWGFDLEIAAGVGVEPALSPTSTEAYGARYDELAAGYPLVPGGVSALSKAGQAADRGGLTRAGRALAKHGGREGSVFPRPTGNPAAINQQGQAALDDILGSVTTTSPNKFGGLDYFGGSTGGGARFDGAGNFIGFLEP